MLPVKLYFVVSGQSRPLCSKQLSSILISRDLNVCSNMLNNMPPFFLLFI